MTIGQTTAGIPVSKRLEETTDQMLEKVTEVVTGNLEALATELRETGELGQLLARAAAGGALTEDDWRKVREQLVDLAKAVPALAIFAAPGGALLLPLLAKVLPFSLLPSAWERGAAPAPAAVPVPVTGGLPAVAGEADAAPTVNAAAASTPAARPR